MRRWTSVLTSPVPLRLSTDVTCDLLTPSFTPPSQGHIWLRYMIAVVDMFTQTLQLTSAPIKSRILAWPLKLSPNITKKIQTCCQLCLYLTKIMLQNDASSLVKYTNASSYRGFTVSQTIFIFLRIRRKKMKNLQKRKARSNIRVTSKVLNGLK